MGSFTYGDTQLPTPFARGLRMSYGSALAQTTRMKLLTGRWRRRWIRQFAPSTMNSSARTGGLDPLREICEEPWRRGDLVADGPRDGTLIAEKSMRCLGRPSPPTPRCSLRSRQSRPAMALSTACTGSAARFQECRPSCSRFPRTRGGGGISGWREASRCTSLRARRIS